MDAHDLMKSRRSIRKYKTDEVPLKTVLKIIETACSAPSWGNKQCWKFIVVDNRVVKNIIGKASGQEIIAQACEDAPYVIILCADTKQSGIKNKMEYYLFDCGMVMQNLLLAAQSEGLSTCVVGWFDEVAVKGTVNMPEEYRVLAFTPLGYADESVKARDRKKLKDVVSYNFWGEGFLSK